MLRLHVLNPEAHWHEHRFWAMGSPAHLIVGGGAGDLVEWALDELERLEQCWSRFRADSELARLNARAGSWVPVSADLLTALVRARRLWERTAAAFDPTVHDALVALGYDRTFAALPADGPVAPLAPAPGFDGVELDEGSGAARLPIGTSVDLGGLGKGLAADLVAEALVERGAASALVELGGDIRVAGDAPDDGWAIPILDPFDASAVWRAESVASGAIVTSTSRLRRWRRGDVDHHHIVDPLTGRSTDTGVAAVVARGSEAWWAEGLAKAAIVVGEAGAADLLEGTGVVATLFRTDGTSVDVGSEATAWSLR